MKEGEEEGIIKKKKKKISNLFLMFFFKVVDASATCYVPSYCHLQGPRSCSHQKPKVCKQHSFILLLFIIFLHLINLYFRGVEMPQENDGFTIAFPDIATAVNFCLRIQYGMRGWGSRDEGNLQNNNNIYL